MAKNDVKIIKEAGGDYLQFDVQDRTSSSDTQLLVGDPVKKSGNYVIHLATGDPEIGTDEFVGIVAEASTETSTADGTVMVFVPVAGKSILRCNATTAGNIDTAAELLGVQLDCVTFDLTSTTFTVDENEGDDPNVHGLQIVGGDVSGYLDFTIQQNAGLSGGTVGQTRD